MARIYCTFVGTMEEAMNRAETMMLEMFESIQEILSDSLALVDGTSVPVSRKYREIVVSLSDD
jgi:hypothetical protein